MATTYASALASLAPVVDNGVLPGDPRVAARLDEAQRRLIEQYNYVSHREESLQSPLVWTPGGSGGNLILDNIDATKLMILCAFREENNLLEMAEALEKKAFGYIERNVINQVERERYTTFSTLALTNQNTFGGLAGRLGLETFVSYKLPLVRLQSFINQAYEQAVDAYNSIIGNERLDIPSISFTSFTSNSQAFDTSLPAEVVRALTLSLIVANADTQTQGGSGKEITEFKQEALLIINRNVNQLVQSTRHAQRKALVVGGTPNTFGYHWARLGLDMPDGLSFSNEQLKRAVNNAEEQLMNAGKWVGTIDTFSLILTFEGVEEPWTSGEVYLDPKIETILFASFDSNPQLVQDRFSEWMMDGPGIRSADQPWRYAFVDRGEAIDPADGVLKKRYFISYPDGSAAPPEVTLLAKKRFLIHTSDSEVMTLRNYQAIAEAAKFVLTDGKLGNMEEAKKLLAAQVNQNYFKQTMGSAHNKKLNTFR